ncbi:surface antigen BspA-like [Trichomonas vaginalis G3]|uniref:Surface antigen BspA-like n=1 Tax=Trichomonas vaginalis (strain ATCC PRA-98 / G3) TaxID=412133 RepID=A2FNE4_TRIV3|nr:BspA type Leucine rich repeat region (6 copies) family [Trichomonas vaginalis G3]EAX93580.1 surface antigen BspA-like [Trichomonas vaginalis G3]KAI5540346.1 BspA type Leucine rich repeat region (6 copies) family [Trichomonas vaginalis G3]|eukprot:XP_001306510.1 surface antigen BspA-like [Trichomonas vaginalis G3]
MILNILSTDVSISSLKDKCFKNVDTVNLYLVSDTSTSINSDMFINSKIKVFNAELTKINKIWSGAFTNCSSLKSILLPKGVDFNFTEILINCKNIETFKALLTYVTSPEDINNASVVISSKQFKLSELNCLKYKDIVNISIVFCNEATIPRNSFKELNKLRRFDLSQSKISSIGTGAFTNINSIFELMLPKSRITILEDAFKNVTIKQLKVTSNLALNKGAFNNCTINEIYIDEGVTDFNVGPFNKCGDNLTINVNVNNTLFKWEQFLLKKIQRGLRKLRAESDQYELIYIPAASDVVLNISEYKIEPHALSYCQKYAIIANPKSMDSLIETCNSGGDSATVFLPSEVDSFDYRYFNCRSKVCSLNCKGTNDPPRTPYPTPIPTPVPINSENAMQKDSVEQVTPVLSVQDDGKTVQMTATLSELVTQSETDTETTEISITDTNSSLTTTYVIVYIRTLIDIVTMTYTNIWIEYNDVETRPGLSTGKVILLSTGCVVLVFLVVMMGLYLYRRTKDNVDNDSSTSFTEMEKDIGHVIDPQKDDFDIESDPENNLDETTRDNPLTITNDSDDMKYDSYSYDTDKKSNNNLMNFEI